MSVREQNSQKKDKFGHPSLKFRKLHTMKPVQTVLAIAAFAAACTPAKDTQKGGDELTMLVGTYTDSLSRECRRGIYTFRFNQQSGNAAPLDTFAMENPSFLTVSESGERVYAVSEMPDSTASVNAFHIDKKSGKLHLLNTKATYGENPCHVYANDMFVLASNYTGGSLSVFPVNEDGSLGQIQACHKGGTGGPDTVRQPVPHIHCSHPSPDGKFVFVSDFSADRLLRFPVTPDGKGLQPSDTSFAIEADSGPRHFIFNSRGDCLYLLGELSGKIYVFSYENGTLALLQTVSTDSVAARGSADIHLSPDGKFLYASNRIRNDGIAIFAVADNGTLAWTGYMHTAIHPRNFCITPNGRYLLAACRYGNLIQVFERDPENGLLKETDKSIRLDRPSCIRFVR